MQRAGCARFDGLEPVFDDVKVAPRVSRTSDLGYQEHTNSNKLISIWDFGHI
jgi:hypothetical protein